MRYVSIRRYVKRKSQGDILCIYPRVQQAVFHVKPLQHQELESFTMHKDLISILVLLEIEELELSSTSYNALQLGVAAALDLPGVHKKPRSTLCIHP